MITDYGTVLQRGGGSIKRLLVISVTALLACLTIASTLAISPAWAGAGGDRRLEVDYTIDYVLVEGYSGPTTVRIDVFRNDVRIGTFTGDTVPDPQGRAGHITEVNHIGGGQPPDGDCWAEPSTPDIQPGDRVVATSLSGAEAGAVDYTFVRDLTFTDNGDSISGHARGVEDPPGTFDVTAPITAGDPEAGGAFIEAKRVGGSLGDQEAEIVPEADGSFTNVSLPGTGGEVFVQYVNPNAAPGEGDESTVAGPEGTQGGPATAECPDLAQYAILNSNPQAINSANKANDLVLSGVSFNADSVSVSLDDAANTATPPLSEDADLSGTTGSQTWTATFVGGVGDNLDDGTLTATATYTIGPDTIISTKQIVKDTTPPATPAAPDLAASSDSGALNDDNITNDATPTFTGTAEAGSTVDLFVDGTNKGSATATGGSYSVTTNGPLASGDHSVTVKATDALGNASVESAALAPVHIDTAAPQNTTANPRGGVYNVAKSVSLTSEAGAAIYFTTDGSGPNPNDPADLYTGPINVSTKTTLKSMAVDVAGNRSQVVTERYTFDTVAPRIVARNPAVNATGVPLGTNVRITFNENVTGVSGATFRLRQGATSVPAVVTYNAATRTAMLNPDASLASGKRYTVVLTSGIRDGAGNRLAPTSWTFTTR